AAREPSAADEEWFATRVATSEGGDDVMDLAALCTPILDLDALKVCVVAHVEGDKNQAVNLCDGDDLPIGKRWHLSSGSETCALRSVPGGSALVVGQNRHRERDDFRQVAFDRGAFSRARKSVAAKPQFVPDDAGGGQVILITVQARENFGVGCWAQW